MPYDLRSESTLSFPENYSISVSCHSSWTPLSRRGHDDSNFSINELDVFFRLAPRFGQRGWRGRGGCIIWPKHSRDGLGLRMLCMSDKRLRCLLPPLASPPSLLFPPSLPANYFLFDVPSVVSPSLSDRIMRRHVLINLRPPIWLPPASRYQF